MKIFQIIKIVQFEIHSKKGNWNFPSYAIAHWLGHKESTYLKS